VALGILPSELESSVHEGDPWIVSVPGLPSTRVSWPRRLPLSKKQQSRLLSASAWFLFFRCRRLTERLPARARHSRRFPG